MNLTCIAAWHTHQKWAAVVAGGLAATCLNVNSVQRCLRKIFNCVLRCAAPVGIAFSPMRKGVLTDLRERMWHKIRYWPRRFHAPFQAFLAGTAHETCVV
jgi:hypothetical protein